MSIPLAFDPSSDLLSSLGAQLERLEGYFIVSFAMSLSGFLSLEGSRRLEGSAPGQLEGLYSKEELKQIYRLDMK